MKQAAEIGTEFATQKINSLAESALKNKLPPEVVHSIQNVATKGVDVAGNKLKTVGVDKVQTLIDKGVSKAENLGNQIIDRGALKGNELIDRGVAKIEGLAPTKKSRKRKKKTKGSAKRQKLLNILEEA